MTKKFAPPAKFKHLEEIFVSLSEMLKPAESLSVSEAAGKYVYLNTPGAYVGPWKNSTVPYMIEPMDTFTSAEFSGEIFVGPAQSSKTQSLILNMLAYSVRVEPMDMMLVCPTMLDGRDFSMRRVDRLHFYSPEIGNMLVPGSNGDNTFDKHYTNGMLFTIAWPTRSQLAGKPIGRIVLTDRDRMDDDVEGDGEPFDLASKRTTTFGRYAMTLAESSPSRPITNLKWIAKTPHEAPPCEGVLGLYNRGDRRRWYWPCPHCNEYFEGNFEHLKWVSVKENADLTNFERADTTYMVCPTCGSHILPDEREEMQAWGRWVRDGQSIDSAGRIRGPAPRSSIASFWLKGVAATFVTWKKLVNTYLDANDAYERTGTEDALKKFYNNDLAEPYVPKTAGDMRLPEVLKSRALRMKMERAVPTDARFLIAWIDVQKNMFRVDVFAVMPGSPFDLFVVDRYDVRKSKRTDHDDERKWVQPHSYLEDWDELIEHVMDREYPLEDGSGRMMGMKFVGCDSGGREGVTMKAYDFYRSLVERNLHRRFILTKGEPNASSPRTRIGYPDSQRKDNKSAARGDIPVLFMNSNLLKDDLNGRLDCMEPGKGMINYPDWLPDEFYNELCAEVRTAKGWENPSNSRNESFDAMYSCLALCHSELLRVPHIDWKNPPSWAAEWDKNDLIRKPEEAPRFRQQVHSAYNFADLGKALA